MPIGLAISRQAPVSEKFRTVQSIPAPRSNKIVPGFQDALALARPVFIHDKTAPAVIIVQKVPVCISHSGTDGMRLLLNIGAIATRKSTAKLDRFPLEFNCAVGRRSL
jgi:hypothetical protein